MNRYEAEYKNMRACYIAIVLKFIALVLLSIVAIWITDSLWGLIPLAFVSNCDYDNFDEKKDKEDD